MVIVGVLKIMIYELLIMNELIIYSCLFPFLFLLVPQDTEGFGMRQNTIDLDFFKNRQNGIRISLEKFGKMEKIDIYPLYGVWNLRDCY